MLVGDRIDDPASARAFCILACNAQLHILRKPYRHLPGAESLTLAVRISNWALLALEPFYLQQLQNAINLRHLCLILALRQQLYQLPFTLARLGGRGPCAPNVSSIRNN